MIKKHTILGYIEAFVAIGAIPAAISMILDPSGENLGLPLTILEGSPFDDLLVPGLFLLVLNGLLQAFGAYIVFRGKPAAGGWGIALGAILLLWISFQVSWIGLISWLQPFYFLIGLVECYLGYQLFKSARTL